MSVPRLDLEIIQGATFLKSINWYGGGKVCRLIEDLDPGCPTLITITGHGLPTVSDTPVYISHVQGAKRANTKPNSPVLATYVSADTFYVDADTVGQAYTSGTGLVTYFAPKVLTGWSARMQIRESHDSEDTIADLTSGAGDITISTNDARISIVIEDSVTATYDFTSAVYDLELEDPAGVTTRLVEGTVELCKEVTR